MANNCNVLMKEAFDNYLGIDMRYKLDDTLTALGKQKLNATQLEGYLLKQGVSPKEIKQAGIFEGMDADSRAISADDWLGMSGRQKVNTFRVAPDRDTVSFDSVTLDGMGAQTDTYREMLTTVKAPKNNVPYEPHFNVNESTDGEQSLLGWRRTHVQEIEGKPALVLNEFQSDWAQTERAKRGTFESSIDPKRVEVHKSNIAFLEKKLSTLQDELSSVDNQISAITKKKDSISDKMLSDGQSPELLKEWQSLTNEAKELKKYKTTREYEVLQEEFETAQKELKASQYFLSSLSRNVTADFPMSEIKHHQFQIVGALDDALKQGIDTIVIPIDRTKNGLEGSDGVTKFYENLNKKILPDLRSKLEKQGLKIKVDKKPYKGKPLYQDDLKYKLTFLPQEYKDILTKAYEENDKAIIDYYRYLELEDIDNIDDTLLSNLNNVAQEMYLNPSKNTENELWKLTVEEIPNKPVKWDVYGLIGALGLSSMLAGEANAEELKPSQLSISPKTNQQTQQQPQPIMEQMTTQPEVIEQPRQQMDEGFSLRKLLESDKLAPEVDEQSTASLFEQLGLVKKDDLGNYRVNKDIDEDSKVDMRKQMPKTIQDQEGEYLTTHRPTKKSGWTIGRGYDSTGRKLQDIINDFAKAGISQQKAIAFFKHKPISINSTQSKALGDIAWQEKVKVAKSIGLPMEELDKDGFLKVMSLVYRGDIVKGGDGYRGRLYNYAKNGNIKAIDRFINTEARNMEGGSVLYNRWKKFNKES